MKLFFSMTLSGTSLRRRNSDSVALYGRDWHKRRKIGFPRQGHNGTEKADRLSVFRGTHSLPISSSRAIIFFTIYDKEKINYVFSTLEALRLFKRFMAVDRPRFADCGGVFYRASFGILVQGYDYLKRDDNGRRCFHSGACSTGGCNKICNPLCLSCRTGC